MGDWVGLCLVCFYVYLCVFCFSVSISMLIYVFLVYGFFVV